jgi:hypothetical protein
LGVYNEDKSGSEYMDQIISKYIDAFNARKKTNQQYKDYESRELMDSEQLISNLTPDFKSAEWLNKQIEYLKIFNRIYNIAQDYHNAIATAQIDTKKFGTSMPQLLKFMQKLNYFRQMGTATFVNPQDIIDNTFLS